MSCKRLTILGCTALSLSCLGTAARAQEAAAAPAGEATEQTDPALKAEIAYVEALIDARLPDLAEDVIAATKKKWPESEAMFFAIEIRGMLALGKFEEAEKTIAALPDRKGAKYWAARLELANNLYARGKREDCSKIYEDFFKNNQKPSKALLEFTRQARYQWGQILVGSGRLEEAAHTYDALLKMINMKLSDEEENAWCNVACETAELYLRLASEADPKARAKFLQPAKKYIDELLWHQILTLYFGRAIAMKAYYELLSGSTEKAQAVINDYKDQLQDIHEQLEKADPDGRLGYLRQSPMPQCRYLMAEKYWKEAQAEYKKPKRDDEKIKSLLFGAKGKNGKRNQQGAFNNAVNVYLRFPQSVWAPAAGRLHEEIAEFAKTAYGAQIKTHATPEQVALVIRMQFQNAGEKFAEGDYKGAIDDYLVALQNYPERMESIRAIENIASAYLTLAMTAQDKAAKEENLVYAYAVAGYLAERFGGCKDKRIMTEAGDAALRVASKVKQMGDAEEAKKLYTTYLSSYNSHIQAAQIAASFAGEALNAANEIKVSAVTEEDDEAVRKEKEALIAERDAKLRDAIDYYGFVEKNYSKSPFYLTALANLSACYGKMGDSAKAIEYMKKYVGVLEGEKKDLQKMQAQMTLAVLYQKDGLALLERAKDLDPESEEAVKATRDGSAQIIRGIKQFRDFAEQAKKNIASPSVTALEKEKYDGLREGALYLAGDCWNRLSVPTNRVEGYRRQAAKNLEDYVAEYPKGKYAKRSYVLLGRIYSQLDDIEKGKNALVRLKEQFPESEEARRAMPQLATSLVEYSKTLPDPEKKEAVLKEVREIYREMLENGKNEYRPIDYVNAGEVLVDAKSWSLAADAFAKAESLAGTNQPTTVAKARLGKAKSLIEQKMYFDAREALDDFMADERMAKMMLVTNACDMLVGVAMQQGIAEKDAAKRRNHFGAAYMAIRKLRNYWSATNELGQLRVPRWQLDRIDLMSSDISLAQMDAEQRSGDQDAFDKACSAATTKLQTFITTKGPTPEKPIEKFGSKEKENIEKAYADILAALLKMGDAHVDEVLVYGRDYERYFPNGKRRGEVNGCIKEALAKGAKEPTSAPAKPAEAAPAEEAPDAPAEAAPAEESPAAPAEAAPAEAAPAEEAPAESAE